jgi:hypothetical protein
MRSMLPARPLRAAAFGLVLWLVGVVIGSVVFAIPQLRTAPEVPHLAANPFITVPIITLWPILSWATARGDISSAAEPREEGIRIGVVYLVVNLLLDLVLVVGAMGAGLHFYAFAGLWAAYSVLLAVPWLTGRIARPARAPVVASA